MVSESEESMRFRGNVCVQIPEMLTEFSHVTVNTLECAAAMFTCKHNVTVKATVWTGGKVSDSSGWRTCSLDSDVFA